MWSKNTLLQFHRACLFFYCRVKRVSLAAPTTVNLTGSTPILVSSPFLQLHALSVLFHDSSYVTHSVTRAWNRTSHPSNPNKPNRIGWGVREVATRVSQQPAAAEMVPK